MTFQGGSMRGWTRPGLTALTLAGLALALGPATARAQAGEVSGTVVEAGTGSPLADARVVLEPREPERPGPERPGPERPGEGGAERHTAWTDEGGRYAFADVAPGWYRLEVSRMGYRAASLLIELPAAWRIRRSLGLEIEPVELRSLRVSVDPPAAPWPAPPAAAAATSPATTAFGTGLERPTLDARALAPADIEDMATLGEPDILRALQRLPGVSGRGDYSAGIWTRGAPWGMTQLLLDGLPLYHPLHFGGAASGLAAEGLEAVLFLPGARPAALSEGAAGVVNLVTRRADADGVVSVGLSPLAVRSHAEDRWLDDRLGVSVTGRRSWWDVVEPPRLFTGGRSGEVGYWFADVFGRVDWRLGPSALIEAGGLWEEDRVDGEIRDLVGGSEGSWGNRLGWVALAGVRNGVRGRITLGRTVHTSRTRPKPWASFYTSDGRPTLDLLDLSLARSLLRVELGGTAWDAVEWDAGLDRARETLEQNGVDAADREAPGGDRRPAAVGWTRLWGQGTARFGPARLSAGVSWDAPAEGDPPGLGVLPNTALRVDPHPRLSLEVAAGASRQFAYPFARAGRSFGPALGVDYVWMIAGEGRSPLTSRVRTASAEWRMGHGFGTTLTGWGRKVEGLSMAGVSAVVEGAVVPMFEDGSEGHERARGVEMSLWRREGRVRGELAYSRGRAEIVAPGGHSWTSPADRRHSLDVTLSAAVTQRLRAGAAFRSESGWPYADGPWVCDDDPNSDPADCDLDLQPTEHSVHRAPGYESLDLVLDWWRPGDSISWGVSLSLRNALGRDNQEAFRATGCRGAELVSVACENPIGPGEFGPGLTDPTPAVAVRVVF